MPDTHGTFGCNLYLCCIFYSILLQSITNVKHVFNYLIKIYLEKGFLSGAETKESICTIDKNG